MKKLTISLWCFAVILSLSIVGSAWEGGWAPEGTLKRLVSYTYAQLVLLVPGSAGELYYDSTNKNVAVSTGTAVNQFSRILVGTGASTTANNSFTGDNYFAKILLDAVGGNSYIVGKANDMIQFYTGGTKNFEIGTSSITNTTNTYCKDGLYVTNLVQCGKFQALNNGEYTVGNSDNYSMGYSLASNEFRIVEGADASVDANRVIAYNGYNDMMRFYTNGTKRFEIGTSSVTLTDNVYFNKAGWFMADALYATDGKSLYWGTGFNYRMVYVAGTDTFNIYRGTKIQLAINANSAVIKSSTTAGLVNTVPLATGEIYFNTDTKKICISTGTSRGNFGSITLGSW